MRKMTLFSRLTTPVIRSTSLLWFSLVMLASTPIMTDWLENRYQVTGQDIAIPLLLNILTASLVTLVYFRLTQRDLLAATIASILSVLIFTNGYESRVQAVYPAFTAFNPIPNLEAFESPIVSLLFIVGSIMLCGIVGRLLSRLIAARKVPVRDVIGGLTVLISVTFALQFGPTLKAFVIEWPQFHYRPPALTANSTGTISSKPDIYYIVLDRYANQTALSSQFNFDNSSFITYLQNMGFTVNKDAHQNYPYTTMSISSTMNAAYQSDLVEKFASASEQTVEPYHDAIRYAAVPSKLKSLGYTYDVLGNWYETSNQAPLADHLYQQEGILTIFGHSIILNNFNKDELVQSAYWRFIELGWHIGHFDVFSYQGQAGQDVISYQIQTLHQLASQKPGGRFIFAHILAPHDPYYYNADGSLNGNSNADNYGESIKAKYVNQLQFISNQIQSVISQINMVSEGKSVIILQADEGPYPFDLNGPNSTPTDDELASSNMLDWSTTDLQLKYDNLAAYHVPAASQDALAKGGDNVNIFRVIFNSYFGGSMPLLPRCYYAYVDGRSKSFDYSDITAKLTGSANAACPATSDFGSSALDK